MTDLLFGIIILALIICFVFYVKETNKEKARLINALVSRTPQDYVNAQMTEKVKPIEPMKPEQQLIDEHELGQEEWEEAIKASLT